MPAAQGRWRSAWLAASPWGQIGRRPLSRVRTVPSVTQATGWPRLISVGSKGAMRRYARRRDGSARDSSARVTHPRRRVARIVDHDRGLVLDRLPERESRRQAKDTRRGEGVSDYFQAVALECGDSRVACRQEHLPLELDDPIKAVVVVADPLQAVAAAVEDRTPGRAHVHFFGRDPDAGKRHPGARILRE